MTETITKNIPSLPGIRFWPGNEAQLKAAKEIEGVDRIVPFGNHHIIYVTVLPFIVKRKLEQVLDAMENHSDH